VREPFFHLLDRGSSEKVDLLPSGDCKVRLFNLCALSVAVAIAFLLGIHDFRLAAKGQQDLANRSVVLPNFKFNENKQINESKINDQIRMKGQGGKEVADCWGLEV